jgi:putative transposase
MTIINSSTPIPINFQSIDRHDWSRIATNRRNLPHWELKGATYFITARVDSSMGYPFSNHELASFMVSCLYRQESQYIIHEFVIMPDHFHLIMTPTIDSSLPKIMQILKGGSSYTINKRLNRSGKFWQGENFDHIIRDETSLLEKMEYIKQNPVRAKLVENAEDYPFSSFFVETCKG